MSREDNWTYGVVEEEKPKLQPVLNALRMRSTIGECCR
jgi:hypothetical protein